MRKIATIRLILLATAAGMLVPGFSAGAQSPVSPAYVTTGIFIGSIEEGARIFTPARLLPFDHPEALGHEFPTVLQLHGGEDRLLVLLGQHAGLRLTTTLQRYPTEPDTLWPYAPLLPPPLGRFQDIRPIRLPASDSPLPGLRAVAFLDRFPVAFIVDTRGLSLAERHMERATSMGLDLTRAAFLEALQNASRAVASTGATFLIYER